MGTQQYVAVRKVRTMAQSFGDISPGKHDQLLGTYRSRGG